MQILANIFTADACVCVRHILRRSAVCNLIPRVNNVRLNVQYVLDALLKEKLCWIIHHCTIEKNELFSKASEGFICEIL